MTVNFSSRGLPCHATKKEELAKATADAETRFVRVCKKLQGQMDSCVDLGMRWTKKFLLKTHAACTRTMEYQYEALKKVWRDALVATPRKGESMIQTASVGALLWMRERRRIARIALGRRMARRTAVSWTAVCGR